MWLLSIAQVLTVVATGAQPGLAVGQTAGDLPDPISTRQTYFAIPFEIDQVDHPVLGAAEIQLYTSRDRGVTWQHEMSVAPTTKNFLFRAPADGEYWFAVRTRDRAGSFRPPLVKAPGLRVVVDTQAPALSIEAQRGQAGQIIAKWKIDETNIKTDTLKLQYRLGESHQWEDVALDVAKMQTDAAISTGESIWFAPAGQGRIEIRAEVADAAGNRNVSHAQVTTVATGAPQMDMMARARKNTVPPATPQGDWRASSGQDTRPQQSGYSNQPGPGQTPSNRDPYSQGNGSPQGYDSPQGYGGDATQMANEPVSNPGYGSGANSGYPSGDSTPAYDPGRGGTQGSGYGVDPNMTAQNPVNTVTPTQPASQPQYGQYAQNSPSQGRQQFDQNSSPSGYGAQNTYETNSTRSGSSGQGMYDRSGMGTVAAQPAPAYQNQYNPGGAASLEREPQTSNRHGSSTGYGVSTQQAAATARSAQTVNTKLVEIAYTNPPQPLAVGRVEVWGTRDGGRTWKSFGFDSDSRSPILTRVPDEGTYGFNVVFHPIHGQPAQTPRRGQAPDILIRVDLTRPEARLMGIDQPPNQPSELTIRWQASDAQLADSPISLYYADATTGQWLPIALNLKNSGNYRWSLPTGLPPQVQIRVDAKDMAGNMATVETRDPVRLAAKPRMQRGSPDYSVEIQDVQPVGQSGQTGPRRYYIR